MKAPCKDCPDRTIHCHSKCEKYLAFAEENKKKMEQRAKDGDFVKYQIEKFDRAVKKKARKREIR